MDPLSDILSLMKPRNLLAAGFEAGGDWAVRFPEARGTIKSGAVVTGACWLTVDGLAEPVRLESGDCFLLPMGRSFGLASGRDVEPMDGQTIFPRVRHGGVATLNGGGDFSIVSARFALEGPQADMLLRLLPPLVHIRQGAETAMLCWSTERIMQELREARPGNFLVVQYLAHMMLVQALRLHLSGAGDGVGWFFALADRQMSAALEAMHAEPARRWSVEELAARAGMSRSAFAARFREAVGAPPMEYLTHWRMLLGADRLAHSRASIAEVALALGYQSESAFSIAFKRVMGSSPRRYAAVAA
ncbi:transcriptional regulator, AraC family [Ancylobacter novellus DSM 506]|uniref:Transcriptional regulator, AraC family n=1 Tax=Ancylobacter novellus (strain ATCC 8093 / DSM 506 / JCM 20403 / CCM 1077 / IAM 12100 / NBRC 12443 / NCIMB 10456) TaxID=639283 RepID=D7A9H0_ANCN5|nr:AraC family transcriptional regulator [Ancylobacter novellus]ADH90732.1 transcriptional regulator, AraC family [Ancylobacter novellus DSM 506]